MSLKVWLPLNGNLNNQGLSNIEIINNGATIDTSGKIGSCYSFDGSDDFISVNYPQSFNNNWTYCCWIYNDDSGGRSIFYGDFGLPNTGNISIEKTTGEKVRFYWNNGSPDVTFNNSIIPVGKWTHLAITYNGTIVTVYINGIQTDTRNGTLTSVTKTGLYYIGRDGRTGTTAFKGKMNDFRIYDECLSQKQIKEIAKGLVCHYKMTMSTINENLLLESSSPNRKYSITNYPCGTYNLKQNVVNGEKYTFSIKVTIEKAYKIGFYFGGGSYTPGWLTFPDSDGTFVITQTFTANANQAAQSFVNVYVRDSQDKAAMGEAKCTIHWIKLEKGEEVTKYVNDAYKQDESITTDCSGYGNNLIQAESITFNPDSPKYNGSTQMGGANANRFYTQNILLGDNSTICCWICPKDLTSTTQWVYHLGNGSGTASDIQHGIYINSSAIVWTVGAQGSYSYALQNNQWYFIATTTDGTTSKLYLNGAEVKTLTPTYIQKTVLTLCNRSGNSDGTSSGGYPFKGSISDVRVYATALSAEEILTLYKNSGIIDNNGNVYTREFKEV